MELNNLTTVFLLAIYVYGIYYIYDNNQDFEFTNTSDKLNEFKYISMIFFTIFLSYGISQSILKDKNTNYVNILFFVIISIIVINLLIKHYFHFNPEYLYTVVGFFVALFVLFIIANNYNKIDIQNYIFKLVIFFIFIQSIRILLTSNPFNFEIINDYDKKNGVVKFTPQSSFLKLNKITTTDLTEKLPTEIYRNLNSFTLIFSLYIQPNNQNIDSSVKYNIFSLGRKNVIINSNIDFFRNPIIIKEIIKAIEEDISNNNINDDDLINYDDDLLSYEFNEYGEKLNLNGDVLDIEECKNLSLKWFPDDSLLGVIPDNEANLGNNTSKCLAVYKANSAYISALDSDSTNSALSNCTNSSLFFRKHINTSDSVEAQRPPTIVNTTDNECIDLSNSSSSDYNFFIGDYYDKNNDILYNTSNYNNAITASDTSSYRTTLSIIFNIFKAKIQDAFSNPHSASYNNNTSNKRFTQTDFNIFCKMADPRKDKTVIEAKSWITPREIIDYLSNNFLNNKIADLSSFFNVSYRNNKLENIVLEIDDPNITNKTTLDIEPITVKFNKWNNFVITLDETSLEVFLNGKPLIEKELLGEKYGININISKNDKDKFYTYTDITIGSDSVSNSNILMKNGIFISNKLNTLDLQKILNL
tara:strand:+ start:1973 stop:3904 length:1932 start_codon:yes stop_codon:yes gene_type:complete